MMTTDQMRSALSHKADTDLFTDEQADQIIDSWSEFLKSLTQDQRDLAYLWRSLDREFAKGTRCAVCGKANDPNCTYGC